jgi:hypothetical protein
VPYRVRGYPSLRTERQQGTAQQLGAGREDLADVRPALLAGLERVAEGLHRTLTIVSGYRTDAYSEQVGGFAGDPHTQGIAADVYVGSTPVGNVPHAQRLLQAAGLVSGAQPGFYKGKPDPAHVQLSGASSTPNTTLEALWIRAGGPPKAARLMAAVALAESGGRVGAEHENSDGSIDYGLWQINSVHSQYDPNRLLTDPLYNARAAVAVYRSSGPDAWTTYTSGAYRSELERAPGATVAGVPTQTAPRTRPGGGSGDTGENELAAWQDYLNPTTPFGPLGAGLGFKPILNFSQAFHAVSDVGSFLRWIAWIFHPRNLLRIVEFTAGAGLMALGFWTTVKVFEGEPPPSATRGAVRALELTPQGRAVQLKRAERIGKRSARADERARQSKEARKRGQKREAQKISDRRFEQRTGRRRGPSEEIPF